MKAKIIKKHYRYFSIWSDLEGRSVEDVIRSLQMDLLIIQNKMGPEYHAVFGIDYDESQREDGIYIAVERPETAKERERRLAKERRQAERDKEKQAKDKALQEQCERKEYERLRKKFEKQGLTEDK